MNVRIKIIEILDKYRILSKIINIGDLYLVPSDRSGLRYSPCLYHAGPPV